MSLRELTQKIGDVARAIRHTEMSRQDLVVGCLLGGVAAGLEGIGVSAFYPILVYFTDGMEGVRAPGTALARVVGVLDGYGVPVTFATLMLIAFAPMILRQFVDFARQVHQARLGARALAKVRIRVLDAIIRAEMSFHLKHHHADLSNTLWIETKRGAMLAPQLMSMITSATLMAVFGIVLVWFAPLLAVFSLPMAFMLFAIHLLVGRRLAVLGRDLTAIQARSAIETNEILGAIRLVKLRRREGEAVAHLDGLLESLSQNRVRSAKADAVNSATVMPLGMAFAGLALYLGLSVFKLSLGEVAVFMIVIVRMLPQFTVFGQSFAAMRNNMPGAMALERMVEDARLAPPLPSGPVRVKSIAHSIAFDSVRFRYRSGRRGREALAGVSFEALAGEMTALVGSSGAGKSTVVDLLSRLYDPVSGRILIDGIDLRDIDLDDWRACTSVVAQETFLFASTVRGNLTYGLDPAPDDAALWAALEGAQAHGFIRAMPQGLDSLVGERGSQISGGQRQRLSLARALLVRPSLLILDEPTAALDGESEAAIRRTLEALRGKTTIVMVAHRLSTIRGADRIVVFEEGRVVGTGTHDTLMQDNTTYRRLFDAQASGEADTA